MVDHRLADTTDLTRRSLLHGLGGAAPAFLLLQRAYAEGAASAVVEPTVNRDRLFIRHLVAQRAQFSDFPPRAQAGQDLTEKGKKVAFFGAALVAADVIAGLVVGK